QGGKWLSECGAAVKEAAVQVDAPPYAVAWQVLQPWPASLQPGETHHGRLRLRNAGSLPWPCAGSQPVHLAYHWFTAEGKLTEPWDTFRIPLPADVAAGAS